MSTRLNRIDHVVIYVEDMDRAVEFYHEILGLNLRDQSDHYTEVGNPGGPYIGLHIADNVVDRSINGQRTEVTFETQEIEKTEELLRTKGVEFTRGATEIAPSRWVSNFVDPFDNPLSLYEHREEDPNG